MRNNWSSSEITILELYYSSEGPIGIQKRLPYRSKSAIQAKASQLGLKYNRHKIKNNFKKSSCNKNKLISFFLCLFLGMFGAHKFYEGNYLLGILYLCTCGLFCVGWFKDTIFLFKNL